MMMRTVPLIRNKLCLFVRICWSNDDKVVSITNIQKVTAETTTNTTDQFNDTHLPRTSNEIISVQF